MRALPFRPVRICAAASLAALAAQASAPARAGEGAALDVIGFSSDASRFAFEQFGAHDASSFPYSELLVIDTTTGADVEGGPFRTLIESELEDVEAARKLTAGKAKRPLERLKSGPGGMVSAVNTAIRPFEELLPMDVYPAMAKETSEMALPASPIGAATVRITTRPTTSGYCRSITDGGAKAMTLSLSRETGAPATLSGAEPPDAQGCPTAYGIAGVFLRPRPDGNVALVVIVSVYPRGFEGPDRRFLAFAAVVPAAMRAPAPR